MATAVFNTTFQNGFRLFRGEDLNAQFSNPTNSTQQSVTAKASGTRSNATPIVAATTNVTTVASPNDSLVMPSAATVVGKSFTIYNNGASAATLYALGSDTINGIAGATGIQLVPGSVTILEGIASGKFLAMTNGGSFASAIFDGATSGTTTLQASAVAGSTTLTMPAVTGTLASTTGSDLYVADIYRNTALTITNSVTPTLIPGLAATVAVGTYRIKAFLNTSPAATGGVAISFVLTTAVLSACTFQGTTFAAAASATAVTNTTTSTTNIIAVASIPLMCQIDGTFTVSTGGTFSLFGCQNTQVNSLATINVGGYMELTRIA